jgi:hypothetical protein
LSSALKSVKLVRDGDRSKKVIENLRKTKLSIASMLGALQSMAMLEQVPESRSYDAASKEWLDWREAQQKLVKGGTTDKTKPYLTHAMNFCTKRTGSRSIIFIHTVYVLFNVAGFILILSGHPAAVKTTKCFGTLHFTPQPGIALHVRARH